MKTIRAPSHFALVFRKCILAIIVIQFGTSASFAAIDDMPHGLKSNKFSLSKEQVLNDTDNRISDEFVIPQELKARTGFWFDIYTKYGSNDYVIHHVLYPWIVYKVVNTDEILNGSGNRWTKFHKAEFSVQNAHNEIVNTLKKLAKRKNFDKLKPLEKELADALVQVPGTWKQVFKEAAVNTRVQLGQRDFFKAGLTFSRPYLPLIEREFAARDLPIELSRLPFVESSFNVKAESKVGASGIWQIMPDTGKSYLIVNQHIDERNSPLKATTAAAKLLRANYRSLKDWPLAVTAYNHGSGGVHKSMRRAKVDNLVNLVQNYFAGSFKFASANFYTSFLAALHAEKYHEELFLDHEDSDETIPETHMVSLEKPMRVRQLMSNLSLTADQLLTYNLDLKKALRANVRLPRGYRLILPAESKPVIDKNIAAGRKAFKEAAVIKKFKDEI